ncbi:MAG: alpha/beta hydrolase, partial [Planctomycetota bacterium]
MSQSTEQEKNQEPSISAKWTWRWIVRRVVIRVLVLCAAAYIGLVLGAYFLQRRLTYFPESLPPDRSVLLEGDEGFEEVMIPTGDGLEIHGVFRPPREGENTLLFLHGNAGNLLDRLPLFREFVGLGMGGLLIDYRGYGRSAGKPTEDGLYEDASSALAWLGGRGVPHG